MLTLLPLLHPSMDTAEDPAKQLDFCDVATPAFTTRLTWAVAAKAIADAIAAENTC